MRERDIPARFANANEVFHRKLFANKARDRLRQMGGIADMPEKETPQVGGIMASSPELMQAVAMRRPVVLPSTTQPTPMPMPQGAASMLPPSRPIPNIAGIPQTGQPQPRPQPRPQPQPPQKPVVKKAEGGFLDSMMTAPVSFVYNKMFELGQKALTSKDPEELGKPDATKKVKEAKDTLKDPEKAAEEIINESLPKEMQTGNTGDDLRRVAQDLGIERVPAEAEVDQLNKAIFGAKLAGAIGGNYVNPQTGEELRPTAGKRIADAAVEGLTFARDTETRRAETEMELAKAKIAADDVDPLNPGAWFETPEGKYFESLVKQKLPLKQGNLERVYEDLAQTYPDLVRKARIAGGAGGGTPEPSTTRQPPVTGSAAIDSATGKMNMIINGETVNVGIVPDMSKLPEGIDLNNPSQEELENLIRNGILQIYD